MMKPTLILVVPLLFAGIAQAADIDPYSGQSLAIEQTKATAELTRAQNSLLEEQTKKAKAEFMLQNADKIFAAELKKQLGQASGAGMGGRQNFGADYPSAKFPEPKWEAKKSAKAKKSAVIAAPPPLVAVYVPPSGPELIGIMQRGDSRVAMLAAQGEIIYAKVGDAVPGLGRVEQIADQSVLIGGRVIAVAQVALANIDKQDIKTLSSMSGAGGYGGTGGMPPGNMLSGMPAASFPMSR